MTPPRVHPDRACSRCGCLFHPRAADQKYCAKACYVDAVATTPDQKAERSRTRSRLYYWRHRELERERERASGYKSQKKYRSAHPIVRMGSGERPRIDSLPEELRPIAHLILEARREIKKGRSAL